MLVTLDALSAVDCDRIAAYVQGLQQADGSFVGDRWAENDSRFPFCALACLALMVAI